MDELKKAVYYDMSDLKDEERLKDVGEIEHDKELNFDETLFLIENIERSNIM